MTYLKLGGAIMGLLALIGAFFYGRSVGMDHRDAQAAKALRAAAAVMRQGAKDMDNLNQKLSDARVAQQDENRSIYRDSAPIIRRPIYNNVCVDGDGVSLLDRAAANANRGSSGEPVGNTVEASPAQP